MERVLESETGMRTWFAMMGRRVIAAIGVFAIAASTACESRRESAPRVEADPEILYSNVWSADSGLDLFSRGAELVRATFEAGEYTYFVGLDKSYPGFREAVGGPARHDDPDKSDLMTWAVPANSKQRPATVFEHITDFTATQTNVSATVCRYMLYPGDEFNATLNPLDEASRIELSNSAESAGLPGSADSRYDSQDPHAHRPPTWNAFGTWKIDKIRWTKTVAGESIPNGCVDWWQQRFPTFTEKTEQNVLSGPEGFVAPTQPVAIQYPEWIGPGRSD